MIASDVAAPEIGVWITDGASTESAEAVDRVLARRSKAAASTLRYGHDAAGRPIVVGAPELRISVSHAGGLLAVAIAAGCRVGVDIEPLGDRELRRLRDHVLTAAEITFIEHHDLARQAELLLGSWTRKEALLKAAGFGLAIDPRRIELPPPGGDPHPVVVPVELGLAEDWWIVELDVPGFAAAVAADARPGRLAVHRDG